MRSTEVYAEINAIGQEMHRIHVETQAAWRSAPPDSPARLLAGIEYFETGMQARERLAGQLDELRALAARLEREELDAEALEDLRAAALRLRDAYGNAGGHLWDAAAGAPWAEVPTEDARAWVAAARASRAEP